MKKIISLETVVGSLTERFLVTFTISHRLWRHFKPTTNHPHGIMTFDQIKWPHIKELEDFEQLPLVMYCLGMVVASTVLMMKNYDGIIIYLWNYLCRKLMNNLSVFTNEKYLGNTFSKSLQMSANDTSDILKDIVCVYEQTMNKFAKGSHSIKIEWE